MTAISFSVLGRPQPAGSKRAFARKGGGVIVTDDNPRAKSWQQEIRLAALDALGNADLLDGPLGLDLRFYFARPRAHFGTGRNVAKLRPGAPNHPIVRPDTTKLIRAVEDALTGIVWRDDAQVVVQIASKRYGSPERVMVEVRSISP